MKSWCDMGLIFSEPEIELLDKDEPIKILSSATTDYKYGKSPLNRSIDELFQYGIINLDKPANPTSHEVVSYVKKILNITKAGHSGTLDPAVTGVLPIALNKATRMLDTLLLAGKEYVTNMLLHDDVDEGELRSTILSYIGVIYQRPPMRASVKRVLRKRTIYNIDILEIEGRQVLFKVECQAGTYIRKLCLHPNTHVLTSNGSMSALQFYNSPADIFSFSNGKIQEKTPAQLQKITAPKELIEITMDSGISFIVTPDHEMLQSTFEGYVMTEAEKLRVGDYIVKSFRIPLGSKKLVIADLLDDEYIIEQDNIREKCKEALKNNSNSNNKINKDTKLINSFLADSTDLTIALLKQAGLYQKVKEHLYRFKTKDGNIIETKGLSESFFYILGFISPHKDNIREKKELALVFNNERIAETFKQVYQENFSDIDFSLNKGEEDLWYFSSYNPIIVRVLSSLEVEKQKANGFSYSLLDLQDFLIEPYLRGYFDAIGQVLYDNSSKTNNKSRIVLTTTEKGEAVVLHKLLLKIQIENRIIIENQQNEKHSKNYYTILIEETAAKQRFIRKIGINYPDKKQIFNSILSVNVNESEYGDKYYIGLHYLKEIKKYATALNNHIGNELKSHLNGKKTPLTRYLYKIALGYADLPPLDDMIIERINDIKTIKTDLQFVYDMTIPETHNFLIETGYVSSNCHDIGQSLGCGAHMKELRRTRTGPFTENNFLSTLHDLYDAYMWYKEEKDERPLRNIILPMEFGVKHLPKVFVKDSAVNTVCHGAPIAIPGIVKYTDNFNAGNIVAIFTLKNELIGLGEAQINSNEIEKIREGIIIRVKRILMPIGTYK